MSVTSFLPNHEPCRELPSYYDPWIKIARRLPELNRDKITRKVVDQMPLLDISHLTTIEQYRYGYSIMSMIAHSYVWCLDMDHGVDILPKNIAIPFNSLASKLKLPTILTHASVDLWNWKLKDERKGITVENIELIHSMTGTESERVFYAVMTEIEAIGSEIISDLASVPKQIETKNIKIMKDILQKFTLVITRIITTLQKMYKGCEPDIFYNVLRKFLNGWGSGNIKNGIIFEGVSETPFKHDGGSAAQSTLIQLFDIIFSVKHGKETCPFLTKMRQYMPGEHREFILDLEKQMLLTPLDVFIKETNNDELKQLYNKCIELLHSFRKNHFALVQTYILNMMPKDVNALGTGGTELKKFLNKCQDETIEKKLNNTDLKISMVNKELAKTDKMDQTSVTVNKMDKMDKMDQKEKKQNTECIKEECIENETPAKAGVVTPWKVEGTIDYMQLVKQFGLGLIDDDLKKRFERVTGKPLHPWIKRGIFFSHRSLDGLLDAHERGEPIFLYTGRGPTSDSMHIGHMIPFMFTKWLQDVFDCVLVIQMADDEKYYFKSLEFMDVYRLGFENAKDIIACGFNPKKTFIFSNRDYRLNVPVYEMLVSEMKKHIPAKQVAKIFGFGEKIEVKGADGTITEHYVFDDHLNVGMIDWPFYQSVAAFSQAFPHIFAGRPAHCLVSYSVDQDNYFRMCRDIAPTMKFIKPCSIISSFVPPLTGPGKMSSSSGTDATIFLTDTKEVIRDKINRHAFSGGGGNGVSLEEHRKYGGKPDVDIPCVYLKYFEFDDDKLAQTYNDFKAGKLTCSDTKRLLADKLCELIMQHQERRKMVTDEVVKDFYAMKSIELPKPKVREQTEPEKKLYEFMKNCDIKYETMYHEQIKTMAEGEEISKRLKGSVCKNLLLYGDDKYYLYVTNATTVVNMKNLPKKLGLKKIKFAEKRMLQELLKVPEGCATIFGVINTTEKDLVVVIDDTIPKDGCVNFHPLRNDATTTISYSDMMTFITKCGFKPVFITNSNIVSASNGK